ncbi:NADP-dependent phosphogluconate dehydrogenase [Roseovarius aestuariivivens]|uniref:NADP-dependent phosphogluconate dehydrogenase n=1 Tax=Roseovarius aestuariivivens TaxID=1888910 RepID=UPI0010815205|nr:NADP-dependent phosphogluconate dehydrogenase [Roseovarius aestuariivivens]
MAQARIGLYGLGTMGSALALNLAEQGIPVAIGNRETDGIGAVLDKAGPLAAHLHPHETLDGLVAGLKVPRLLLLMIPSDAPVDEMIAALLPRLAPEDTLIDGGNADFHDTRRRAALLSGHGLHYVGLGISGGEAGARHGPSMMFGGSIESWDRLRDILMTIAARYEGDPCVDRMGPDGTGHFVKTVHNGIEYAEMQVLAEIYGLLHYGAVWPAAEIGKLFETWANGPLRSYLLEITARLLQHHDPETGHPMVDVITDSAGQKGTGRWSVIEALRLGQSLSTVEAAVAARNWSAEKDTRQAVQAALGGARDLLEIDAPTLSEAMLAARILGHAQGFRLLRTASEAYDWGLDLARIAEIWRAGCIIRSDLLSEIATAFRAEPPGGELILAPQIVPVLQRSVPALRQVVSAAVAAGHAVPVLSAALQWHDTMRQGFGTANILQAQRDMFGRHGFARLGREGVFHGPWWD